MEQERWKRIDQLFHSARQRQPGERAAFLKEVCAGDESLRCEVESLLGCRPDAEAFIESPAIEMAARALAQDETRHRSVDLTGQTFLHYRITKKIGEGGMGEVYEAHDAKLNRQVALKVLPDVFASDPERLARFDREAKLLASLNHPNIAGIYGLEETKDKRFLVLELIEGETLAQRIGKGRLAVEETLGICRQIAEGLEAAHEKGVIHRDLKPANVKITPEGKVKILDFGLAKVFQAETASPDMAQSPTIGEVTTHAGVILGTAAYMSPEQARGKPVDKRTDIWAFGCVLFECLTGKRAFEGEAVTETMAAILKGEPDWHALPVEASENLRAVLRRCLQKDASHRLRDIGDARIEIGESIAQPSGTANVSRRYPFRWIVACAAVMLLASILIGVAWMNYWQPATSSPVVRSVIKLEPGLRLDGMSVPLELDRPTRTAVAISNDGRFIIYSAIANNPGPQVKAQLYLRRTDGLEAKPIPGTEGGVEPFLSPDDRWVGFGAWVGFGTGTAGGNLMKVPIDGGVPVRLCGDSKWWWPFGASWGSNNRIVFAPAEDQGLFEVSADGGKPEPLTLPDKTKEEYGHRLPHYLPDGKGILFTIMRYAFDLQPCVAVFQVKTRTWRVLMDDASDARFVPGGYIVFLRQGTLMAAPFDPERLEVTGQLVPAVDNVLHALNSHNSIEYTAAGQFSISNSGQLLYAVGGIRPDKQGSLVWVDQTGGTQTIASFTAPRGLRLSPDGQRIAYYTFGKEENVWVYDIKRGTASRLNDEGRAKYPAWKPDGKRVAFGWSRSGADPYNLYWRTVDGSSPMERLTTSESEQYPGSWSPDGGTLAFVEARPAVDGYWKILLLDMGSRRVTHILNSGFGEMCPAFSPDGRWLAYSSVESGRNQVYVRPFPGPGGKWQISNDGGVENFWAPNGKQLFYRRIGRELSARIWAVDVQSAGGFSAGKPRLLFEQSDLAGTRPVRSSDISRDGQRFLMVKNEEIKLEPVTELILVQNWFEELKRLVPTGKK